MLFYTQEQITSPEGEACQVLDVARVDFSDAVQGQKVAPTIVRPAFEGEEIKTCPDGQKVESVYMASAGDAVFINLHNSNDMYVPVNANGARLKVSELAEEGYEIVSGGEGSLLVKRAEGQMSRILHEAVDRPTCIKDAWGAGKHQFLYAGASLKESQRKGKITGIEKQAFEKTWKLCP